MAGGVLYAQDTIKTFIISETRPTEARYTYLELTNMGTEPIDLHNWEVGTIGPWTDHYLPESNKFIMLGDYIDKYVPTADTIVEPGESFWMSPLYEFQTEKAIANPLEYDSWEMPGQRDADIVLHAYEAPSGPTDSISVNWQVMEVWNGRDCYYVRYHLPNGDSVAVDQVGGVWDQPSSSNGLGRNYAQAYDVAGVEGATNNSILVRKFSVKEGNLNFNEGRGITPDESEWIVLPYISHYTGWTAGRPMYWTVGNHGNFNVDETTLKSSTIDIDWDNSTLNVPWGVFFKDSLMFQFDRHEGLAWNYILNNAPVGSPEWEQARLDSSFISARTGDTLIVWACGDDLDEVRFHINLLPPTEDANWIIPKAGFDWDNNTYSDYVGPVFEVTAGVPGGDTILDIPFATRTDSIMKYFEKAPNASWEFVFVDGVDRADVMDGDLLRVTAENGAVKDYYLDVADYTPGHDAELTAITWPDIPVNYKNLFGYVGDTIPGFVPGNFSYKAIVPMDVEAIPALVATPRQLNTKVEVERAVSLYASIPLKTVTFTSTAEDDTTILVYKVELQKERDASNIQPWKAEPFLSEYIFQDQWSNSFMEICNPGTEPLDLSDYLIFNQWTKNPVQDVSWNSAEGDFDSRYQKYIPGYKWVSETDLAVSPCVAVVDLNVNPIVQPGDVFTMGAIRSTGSADNTYPNKTWPVYNQLDINFRDATLDDGTPTAYPNPWGEEINGNKIGTIWSNGSWYMYKILNDSIKKGLKPANDPEDFMLIESWANPEDGDWIIGGRAVNADNQCVTYIRKEQYYLPKAGLGESFGTQVDNGTKLQDGSSEWYCWDRNQGILKGYGWPHDICYVVEDLGKHYMIEPTIYMSTVTSLVYQVSLGYSDDELIKGVVTGTKVNDFMANIFKRDEGQTLTVRSGGVDLGSDAAVSDGDSLVVVSADGENMSKYLLEVTAEGLNSDAVLTSTAYTVEATGDNPSISGFDYGTLLKDVKNGVTLPAGASMTIINQNGAYVALQKLNKDTTYVNTQVSDMIWFVVTAEDNVTKITYQLMPTSTTSDAFVISEVYGVDQDTKLISLIPKGTSVATLYANVTPSSGASIQVKDKNGSDRAHGTLVIDDVLTVTAADGETQTSYFFAFLNEEVTYLAYVLSNTYIVDQNASTIEADPVTDINEVTLVSDFLANLSAAPGAMVVLKDADGNVKDGADNMDAGDYVQVTAGNGVNVKEYSVNVDPSAVEEAVHAGISVYPNPSNGQFHVDGLDAGNRIQVYNSLGARVLDRVADGMNEIISLQDQHRGFYFMTISNKAGVVGNYKLIVE
jgi:hypothetical protein